MVSLDLLVNAIVAGLLVGGFYAAVRVGIAMAFGWLDVATIAHPVCGPVALTRRPDRIRNVATPAHGSVHRWPWRVVTNITQQGNGMKGGSARMA
jgi:hypothetical protein